MSVKSAISWCILMYDVWVSIKRRRNTLSLLDSFCNCTTVRIYHLYHQNDCRTRPCPSSPSKAPSSKCRCEPPPRRCERQPPRNFQRLWWPGVRLDWTYYIQSNYEIPLNLLDHIWSLRIIQTKPVIVTNVEFRVMPRLETSASKAKT